MSTGNAQYDEVIKNFLAESEIQQQEFRQTQQRMAEESSSLRNMLFGKKEKPVEDPPELQEIIRILRPSPILQSHILNFLKRLNLKIGTTVEEMLKTELGG